MSEYKKRLRRLNRTKANPNQRCENCDWVEPCVCMKMMPHKGNMIPAVLCGLFRKMKPKDAGKYCGSYKPVNREVSEANMPAFYVPKSK